MNGLAERLERGTALMRIIDRSRQETGDPNRGANIERMLIDRMIRDLEADADLARRSRENGFSASVACISAEHRTPKLFSSVRRV